ncbi:MAG: sensor histidine kinase, partial [Thermoplasmatota archaeon]
TDPTTGEAFASGFRMGPDGFEPIDDAVNASVQQSALIGGDGSGPVLWGGQAFLAASKALILPGIVDDGGTMIVARAIDDDYLQGLVETTGETVLIRDVGQGFQLERHGLDSVHAIQSISGPDGEAFAIETQQSRDLYVRGLMGFLGFLAAAAIMSIGILVLTLYLLRRFMVRRIQRMSRQMMALQQADRLTERVRLEGNDELSDMAQSFDALMDTLETRTKRLDRFASVVSHDLQSPLSTFALNIALLRRTAEATGDKDAMTQLDRMERTSQHMQRHIRAVLDYARDRDHMPDDPVDMEALLDEVMEDMDAELRSADAELIRHPLPTVRGDASQIRQVLQNVLQNAIKYRKVGEPAKMRIRARRRGRRWQLRVDDQGRGFDNGDAPHMIQPFSRLDNTDGADGHGVGLSICADLVERHGGHLAIQGRPGIGTSVTFDLPAVEERPPRPAARPATSGRVHPQA